MFFKIIVFKKFKNFAEKHLRWSLLNKVEGSQNFNFIKKDSDTGFSCEI